MDKPLQNVRVVITRPEAQADALSARLAAYGAIPVVFPVIQIVPVTDMTDLDRAIRELASYDWVIFTSVNSVDVFLQRCRSLGVALARLPSLQTAAVGSQTARHLADAGIPPAFVPDEYVAERIVEGLGDVQGRFILLPHGQLARKSIPRLLRTQGARVDDVTIYRTVQAEPDVAAWAVLHDGFEAILFTSASTVRHFLDLADETVRKLLRGAVVGCIGPVTARAAHVAGLTVDVVPDTYTTPALVDALVACYARING